MTVSSFNLQLYVDRVKAQTTFFSGRIYGAAELDAALSHGRPRQMPSCYLVLASGQASPNNIDTGFIQQDTARFSVIIAIRNVADSTGMSSHVELKNARDALFNVLLNWSPAGNYLPAELHTWGLRQFQNGVIWWEDVYRAPYYLEG